MVGYFVCLYKGALTYLKRLGGEGGKGLGVGGVVGRNDSNEREAAPFSLCLCFRSDSRRPSIGVRYCSRFVAAVMSSSAGREEGAD